MNGKNYRQHIENLRKQVEGKQAQRSELEYRLSNLRAQVDLLVGKGNFAKAADAQIQVSPIETAIETLTREIGIIEPAIVSAEAEAELQAAYQKLLELGKLAKKQRGEYEERWHQIHAMLEKQAPAMVSAYGEWHSTAARFYEILLRVEPGVWSERHLLAERGEVFLDELKQDGVDLDTMFFWPDLRSKRKGNLPVLDGSFLKCIELAHEVAQFGRELWGSERTRFKVDFSKGAVNKFFTGQGMRRGFFPIAELTPAQKKMRYGE